MIDWNTKNKTFINMHFYLKNKGINNNTFFLTLLDPSLQGVDPYDPNLTQIQKARVLREVLNNYWYFLREVVRIQSPGGGKMYELNPAFLAFHFLSEINASIYFEVARQIGKTTAVLVRKLYTYNFKARNSTILFFHKTHSDSKSNLNELKKIRDSLPQYLRMSSAVGDNGKKLKSKNSIESIQHVINKNTIITMPSASTPEKANSLARGKTATELHFDEHAFLKYNDIIYASASPAFITASNISKKYGNPYGIVITTTAGSRDKDYAEHSYQLKESATKWDESFYDLSVSEIHRIIDENPKNMFVYVKYMYYEIGYSRKWFENIVKNMASNWAKIRREYLLEWEYENNNNPFEDSDLEIISTYKKTPIHKIMYGAYVLNIYEDFSLDYLKEYPPLIGVDVASSEGRNDSTTLTIVDSKTTKVIGTLNSNYIGYKAMSNIIIDIVKRYYPKAVVNVETNGGYGDSIIEQLKNYIRGNLYWEVVEKVIEERNNGFSTGPIKKMVKRYGTNSNKNIRNDLINILYNRVEYHKDKFSCPILIDELKSLQIKKNSKIEHSEGNHDDQIFSYLLALYIWYEGKDIQSKFNIKKFQLESDEYSNMNDDEYSDISEFNDERKRIDTETLNAVNRIFSNDEIESSNPTRSYFTDIPSFSEGNINIPKEYINSGKVFTLENNRMLNNNDNNINNFSMDIIDNNDNNLNKNFWQL